jgi:hypothetical protein
MGIDGDSAGRWTKQGATQPLSQWQLNSDHRERSYSPNSKKAVGDAWVEVGNTEMPMRRLQDFQFRAKTRDIFDLVQKNDGDHDGASAPVRYGTDLDN